MGYDDCALICVYINIHVSAGEHIGYRNILIYFEWNKKIQFVYLHQSYYNIFYDSYGVCECFSLF